MFKVGDLVQSIPDTTPGVDSAHSVAITGASKEPFVMYIIYPSPRIHLTHIFNLALCETTLLKYSVAWQGVKEATHRPNLLFFCFIPHFIRILFLFFLAFLNFFPSFFILLFLSPLFLRSSEDPSFEASIIQAGILSLELVR